LLAAPLVEIGPTAVVSALGGGGRAGWRVTDCAQGVLDSKGGAGGNGRVKIASETTVLTGTVSGSFSTGHLPPMKFVSPTHPNFTVAYNDAFAEVRVAWQKPYATAKGVFYVLDQAPSTAVTQANGTFTTATELAFPSASFASPGTWYVHLATVHSDDTLSPLSSTWSVRVSAAVPEVWSTSHPDPETWYPGKTAATFAWQAPADIPPGSYVSYFYRLDRTSNSVMGAPNAPGWMATNTPQVLLTSTTDGAPLGNGAYHFHVVPVDTQGRLTRDAAHTTILVVNTPPSRGVFGYVKTSANGAISGASVGLEPFGLTATTDANGYFLLPNVFDGDYMISSSKAGFKPSSSTLAVSSATAPITLVLVP
jgi:hypothetical protein